MPPIRAVVFDLGHTLWDYAPTEESGRFNVLRLHARLEAALGAATPAPKEIDRAMAGAAQRWVREWYEDRDRLEQPSSDQPVRAALRELRLALPEDVVTDLTAILFARELDVPVVAPDSLATIASLHERGLALGCITNTVLLDEGIADIIARLGLRRYFNSVVVSSAMGYRKPHPSLFQRALADLGVAADQSVFVGDRLFDDISGAKAVAMRAVLTHQYRQEPPDSGDVTPDAVIRRLSELPGVIERIEAPAAISS